MADPSCTIWDGYGAAKIMESFYKKSKASVRVGREEEEYLSVKVSCKTKSVPCLHGCSISPWREW